MIVENPYDWSVPNEKVFIDVSIDGIALVERMRRALESTKSFALCGGTGMGKTTVLYVLKDQIKSTENVDQVMRYVPVYVDVVELQRRSGRFSQESVWAAVFNALSDSVSSSETRQAPQSADGFLKAVRQLVLEAPILNRLISKFVIMLDNVRPIIDSSWGNEFFGIWHSWLGHRTEETARFCLVCTGAREMFRLKIDADSPIAGRLKWIDLKSLSYAETVELISIRSGVDWSDGFKRNAYAATGGQPKLLQYVMQELTESMGQSIEQPDDETVRAVFEAALVD